MAKTDAIEELTPAVPELTSNVENGSQSSDKPTMEEIAREAYAIYMANGSRDGSDLDDWLEAERRLSARSSLPPD